MINNQTSLAIHMFAKLQMDSCPLSVIFTAFGFFQYLALKFSIHP